MDLAHDLADATAKAQRPAKPCVVEPVGSNDG